MPYTWINQDVPGFVYRHLDADGAVLYIGCTKDVAKRQAAHRYAAAWAARIARIDVTPYPTLRDAIAAEKAAIATERPPFNVASNPAKAQGRAAYLNRPAA